VVSEIVFKCKCKTFLAQFYALELFAVKILILLHRFIRVEN
jgi:hypothetical protein